MKRSQNLLQVEEIAAKAMFMKGCQILVEMVARNT